MKQLLGRVRPLGLIAVLAGFVCVPGQVWGANPIQTENALPGTSSWRLTNPSINHEIEGYASLTSVNVGGSIDLMVSTADATFQLEIFRMGWYGGLGGRSLLGPVTVAGGQRTTPPPDPTTGMVECNWPASYTLSVPSNWVSGFYLAKLTGNTTGKQSYIIFIVREDSRLSPFLFLSSTSTWQAYNGWGGKSLYEFNSGGVRATKVSYNRPYGIGGANVGATFGVGSGQFMVNAQGAAADFSYTFEYPMVQFFEKNGYDFTYISSVDLHSNPAIATGHKALLSIGHDEYYSWEMRANIINARDSGIHIGFFGSNDIYWQVRFENSPISGAANRTMVCYKQTAGDPQTGTNLQTTLWRNLNLPESAVIGSMYGQNPVSSDFIVTAPQHWVFANTGLQLNSTLYGLVGYETSYIQAGSPANTVQLAKSNPNNPSDMTIYQASSGAWVYSTGSMFFLWCTGLGLGPTNLVNTAAQQIIINVLTTFQGGVPPVISSFSASPSSINSGASSTLSWNVTGATSLSIDQGIGAVTGTSVLVTPAITTTYTLTATNAAGPATATTTVQVDAPVISSIAPATGPVGSVVNVTISGSKFTSPAGVASPAGIAVSNVAVVNATTITATFTIAANAAAGNYNIQVTTGAGASNAFPFTVLSPPALTSISPNAGTQGQAVAVTLTGTNFVSGATVGVSGSGVTASNVAFVNATTMTATLTAAANAPTGSYNVTVTTAGGTSNAATFTVNAPSGPTIGSLSPNGGVQGQTLTVTITGTNFVSGATVGVSGTGITVSNVVVNSSSSITASFAIAASAATGARNVTVATGAGTSNSAAFTVSASGGSAPTLASVSPSQGAAGTAVPVTLTGANFIAGATVAVDGTTVTPSNVVVVDSATITATFTIRAGATPRARNVTVTTSAGVSNPVAFNVVASSSTTVSSISPASGAAGQSVPVTITGTNFATGATVGVSGSGVTASNVNVVNATTMTATLAIASNAAPGPYNVTVTSGGSTSNAVAFNVNPPPPTAAQISPSSGAQGQNVSVTITGTNFVSGATVGVSGSGVTASNVVVSNSTTITATLGIAASATTGLYNVSVTTGGGTSNAVSFTVNQAPPAVTQVSPSSGQQGQSVNVTITGSNFIAGATVGVSGSGVTASNVVVSNATAITATLAIAANAATGPYNVTVATSGGTSNAVTFTVNQATPPPTATGIAPASGVQGQSVPVTITGSNFVAGASLGVSGTGVTAANVLVVDQGTITATLSIAANAPAGARSVTVSTSGGTSNGVTFTVNQAPPAVSQVSPSSGTQGQSVAVTITGTNFVSGATVGVSGSGVTASNVVVVNTTTMTATLAIASNAATGAYNVTVATSGGTSNAVSFTVNQAPPAVSQVSPSSGTQGQSVAVTITGTNFVSGATVGVSGSGVTASNVVVVNATTITATLAIAANASASAYNVTVTTTGGTSNAVSFTVNPAPPTVSQVSPSSGTQGQSVAVTITGTNFVSGATVGVSGSGVTASNVVVVNATTITATLAIASNAATGAYNVTVATSGGTSNAVSFTVNQAPPAIALLTPAGGNQGQIVSVTIQGSGFIPGASVNVSGTGVTVSNVVVVNVTAITATLTIAANAPTGSYNVTVGTTAGTSNAAAFSVSGTASGVPTIANISPASAYQGAVVPVTITGTNFTPAATITIDGTTITSSNLVVVNSTTITATFSIKSTATPRYRNVWVSTGAGQSNAFGFAVLSTAVPALTSLTPAAAAAGQSVTVTVVGSNFDPATTLQASGGGVTLSNVTFVNTTQMTATFTVAAGTPSGPVSVTAVKTSGSSNALAFTVQ